MKSVVDIQDRIDFLFLFNSWRLNFCFLIVFRIHFGVILRTILGKVPVYYIKAEIQQDIIMEKSILELLKNKHMKLAKLATKFYTYLHSTDFMRNI